MGEDHPANHLQGRHIVSGATLHGFFKMIPDVHEEFLAHVADEKSKGAGHKFDHPEHTGEAPQKSGEDEDVESSVELDAFPPLTTDQVARAMTLFDQIDRDSSGTVDATELTASVRTASSDTYNVLGDLVTRSIISRSLFAGWLAEVKTERDNHTVEAVLSELARSSR